MKKTISLLALGAVTAFCTVNAQDKQQMESTSTDHAEKTHQQQSQNVQDQDKKKIDKSELPDQVKQGLKESEYAGMDILVVYEVEESGNVTQNKEKTVKWNEAEDQSQTQTSNAAQDYADKGVEYDSDSETGYSTSPGEEQTYPETEYNNSQTDQDKQTTETSSADQLNEGDQQRQNDQLNLEEDPKPDYQSQATSSDNMDDSEKMYEVQVEDEEEKVMILVFTKEGELRQATESEDGM